MFSTSDEIVILLKALDTLEKEDLTDSAVLDRWTNLYSCLRSLLWKTFGHREHDR